MAADGIGSIWKSVMNTAVAVAALLALTGSPGYAQEAVADVNHHHAENLASDPLAMGFFLSLPAYLYDRYSAFGFQTGYQYGHVQARLDISAIFNFENGKDVMYAIPALGLFATYNWAAKVRVYEGIAVGGETGITNSFDGHVYYVNYVAGGELLSFERKAFFVEFGTGLGFMRKAGAFNGGTAIGGGIKYYFGNPKS